MSELAPGFGVMILIAVILGNWAEAGYIQQNSHGWQWMWFIATMADDGIAALFILGLLRLMSGGSVESLWLAVPWAGVTFAMLRAGGAFNFWGFIFKLADDIRDGSLIILFLIFWNRWGSFIIPAINFSA